MTGPIFKETFGDEKPQRAHVDADADADPSTPLSDLRTPETRPETDPDPDRDTEKQHDIIRRLKAEEAGHTSGDSPDSFESPDTVAPSIRSQQHSDPDPANPQAPQDADQATQSQPSQEGKDDDAPEASRTKLETTIIMLALCSALFLAALDITIIATAVPTIAAEFKSNLGYTWIGSAFILANGACVPIWGKISDIWGRKPILLLGTGVFWLGSLLCGVSVNMAMLIASRAVQGAGSGGIITLVNICISDLFSMRNRGFYFGMVGVVWAIASAIGPILGGVFTAKLTWRWCFYINLPICGVGMLLLFFVLKLHNPRTSVRRGLAAVDWLGSLTIVGSTVMFLLGLEFGGISFPWSSPTVLCLLIFGALTFGVFCVIEWKVARYPIMPLHLFRDWSNVASLAVAFCQSFVFLSGSYFLPLYFQGALGLSTMDSGAYLLAYVVPLSVVSAGIGLVIKGTGNYKIGIVTGLAIMTLGFGLFINLDEHSSLAKIMAYQVVAGIGVGPNFQAPLIALQAGVEPRDIASATSTYSFMRQIAGSMSIVVGGATFNNGMQKRFGELSRKLGPEMAERLSGHNAAASVAMVRGLKGEEAVVARGAYAGALQTMYIVYVAFAGLGLVAGVFVRQKNLSKKHTEYKTGLRTLRSREPKRRDEEGGETRGAQTI